MSARQMALAALKFAYNESDSDFIRNLQIAPAIAALEAEIAQEVEPAVIPFSGADETPPVFARRWRLADDGFGLQRDDNGNYVQIDDALSVLHATYIAQPVQPTPWAVNAETLEALKSLVEIIDKAGVENLSNGVQLGRTSWYVKATNRLEYAHAAIKKAEGAKP